MFLAQASLLAGGLLTSHWQTPLPAAPARQNADLLERIGHESVRIYYDVGNSFSRGYDVPAEIRFLKGRIADRKSARISFFRLGTGALMVSRQ